VPELPDLSVQLYSVRERLVPDFQGTLAALREIGLTRVEPFGMLSFVDELATGLERHGLTAPTTHQSLVEVELGEVFDTAARLSIGTVIHPFTPAEQWETADDVAAVAELLNSAAAVGAASGIRVGYHNHAWELSQQLDGRPVLEVLVDQLDPAVVLEVDTYWAAVGGQDVPALLKRLGDRVVALHLKDGPLNGVTQDQLPLGSGELPAADILAAATALEVPVLEFDQYAGDMLSGVADAYAYATTTLGFAR
jgi:sugar phosphate isomerase/epimerase